MFHSIYFRAFLGRCVIWPIHQRMHAESASAQMSAVWLLTNVTAPVNKMHAWHFPLWSRRTWHSEEKRAGCFAVPYSHVPNVLFGISAPRYAHICPLLSCTHIFPSLIKYSRWMLRVRMSESNIDIFCDILIKTIIKLLFLLIVLTRFLYLFYLFVYLSGTMHWALLNTDNRCRVHGTYSIKLVCSSSFWLGFYIKWKLAFSFSFSSQGSKQVQVTCIYYMCIRCTSTFHSGILTFPCT